MLLSGVTYEPFGPVSGWTWADGTAHTRSYNLRGELVDHSLGGGTRILTHDDAGRITDLTDAGTDVRVSYDALHRITGATSHLGTTRPPSQAFTYDANGNRLTLTEGSATETMTYAPDSNRLATVSGAPPVTVVLDAAGNTLDDGRHSYTYDDRGRLVAVDGTVTYQINALGQRVAKAAAEARLFAYDPAGQLTGEYTTSGTPVTEVIFLGDIPVAALQGTSVYQVHADHLNTPRRLVEGGTVRWSWEADVFGAGAAQDDPDGDGTAVTFHWRFPGQYYDAETGHHYNYYRTYDPASGRYLESDPIGLDGGLNTYSYVSNMPTTYVDPFGLDVLLCKRPADLPWPLSLGDHAWIKTDTAEAGMGADPDAIPAQGNSDKPFTPVQVVDHTGQSLAENSTCEVIEDVDEDKVNELLRLGRPLGRWGPGNHCQSFTSQVLWRASIRPPLTPPQTPIPGVPLWAQPL